MFIRLTRNAAAGVWNFSEDLLFLEMMQLYLLHKINSTLAMALICLDTFILNDSFAKSG